MRTYCILLVTLFVFLASACAFGDEIIWQIGRSDNDYSEFAIAGKLTAYPKTFPTGVHFEIGKSDPAKDWSYIQPGGIDAWAGPGDHPSEIVFNLENEPQGTYVLTIDLVDLHGGYGSSLQISTNNSPQLFDLDPGANEEALHNPKKGVERILQVYVLGGYLRKGKNTIVISPAGRSWALYDCVTFSTCTNPPKDMTTLTFSPTFLFKNTDSGLKQIMKASVDVFKDQSSIKTVLTSEKGWSVEQTFSNLAFGRQELEIETPVVTQQQNVHVKVFIGDETFEADSVLSPQKQWKIYLMPSTHFDLGYTDIQDRVLELHRNNNDNALEWIDKYPGFIWNLEGSYLSYDYLTNGKNKDRFIAAAKNGSIGVQGFFGNELTGICSSEGLTRLVDYVDVLRNEYGIESDCAMETDVPTMVATIPMILNGHGIKYLSHGINATRARSEQDMLSTPHYWQSPDGSKVLMWKTWGYGLSGALTGAGESGNLTYTHKRVNEHLSGYVNRTDYPFDAMLMHGGYADNCPNTAALVKVPAEWNSKYAYPKFIFCKGTEFFKYIEANFAKDLKTETGDGGVWWEDGAASSALETARNRKAKTDLISAEKLAVLCGKEYQEETKAQFDEAWRNVLLYDEHTWGAGGSIDAPEDEGVLAQWAVKKSFADRAAAQSADLLFKVIDRFCSEIPAEKGDCIVINSSGWARSENVTTKPWSSWNSTALADSVPAVGYKVLHKPEIIRSPYGKSDNILENKYYKIIFDKDSGAITSIFDKELQRELVDSTNYQLNEFLYTTLPKNCEVVNMGMPKVDVKIERCSAISLHESARHGGQSMSVDYKAPKAKRLITSVILYDDQKRIDFENDLDKEANLEKEAGYFAFPFAFKNPEIRIEIPNGVIRPEADQFKAACRDWYCVDQFMTISDGSASVVLSPIDSPLITLQDINRGQWYDHIKIENGNVFGYVFNNYWFTNYKASQEGKLKFRFSMTSGKSFTDAQAKKFAEEAQNPLIVEFIRQENKGTAVTTQGYLQVDSKSVVLQAMKPARFTSGTVIRLREMNGANSNAKLTVSNKIPFKRAWLCNLAEDKQSELKVNKGTIEVPCKALGLTTVLLEN